LRKKTIFKIIEIVSILLLLGAYFAAWYYYKYISPENDSYIIVIPVLVVIFICLAGYSTSNKNSFKDVIISILKHVLRAAFFFAISMLLRFLVLGRFF
jgi:hypothetical protein